MGYSTQKWASMARMTTSARPAPTLTAKGQQTRARIIEAAAALVYERGVAATTLEDVKTAAEVSGSQLSHYFADKDGLVRAVVDRQADAVVGTSQRADLGTLQGLRAWRDLVVTEVGRSGGRGGCPLGALGSQLAESEPRARGHLAAGFARWSAALGDGLRALHATGHLRPDVDPDDLAATLLAAVQGGLLLAQVHRDTRPLETALDTVLALAVTPWARAGEAWGARADRHDDAHPAARRKR